MAKYTIVMIRHGESEWNKENRFSGWHDADLSVLGVEEAKNSGKIWRRSYITTPPAVEMIDERWPGHDAKYQYVDRNLIPRSVSLKDTVARALPLWHDQIVPEILKGQKVAIVAHSNSLRAMVTYLDDMTDADIMALNIPSAIPLVYELDANLRPVKHYYLADEAALKEALDKVVAQGKAKST